MLTPFILCLVTANSVAAAGAIFVVRHICAFTPRLRSRTSNAAEDSYADVSSFAEDVEIRDAVVDELDPHDRRKDDWTAQSHGRPMKALFSATRVLDRAHVRKNAGRHSVEVDTVGRELGLGGDEPLALETMSAAAGTGRIVRRYSLNATTTYSDATISHPERRYPTPKSEYNFYAERAAAFGSKTPLENVKRGIESATL